MVKRTNRVAWGLAAAQAVVPAAATNSARAQGPFSDVPAGHPAEAAVSGLAKQGLVHGYPNGTFDGRRAITHREFVLALWRVAMRVEQELAKFRPANAPAPPLVQVPPP